jgi:hypothetical protein
MKANEKVLKKQLQEVVLSMLSDEHHYFYISNLRKNLPSSYSSMSQGTLNKYLSAFARDGIIFDAGRGWYSNIKMPFELNKEPIEKILSEIKGQYPLLEFSCWTTEQIKDYLQHMINRFVTFIFVEKESMTGVYEFLRDKEYNTWLNPRGREVELFTIRNKTVVIRQSISKEPVEAHAATIEKVLIDLYVEAGNLKFMDLNEYMLMQQNIITSGRINIASLISYAKRRKLDPDKILERK